MCTHCASPAPIERDGENTPPWIVIGLRCRRWQAEQVADDYLTKPLSLLELLARIQPIVRRANGTKGLLEVGDLRFDLRTLIIRRGDRLVGLTPTGMLELNSREP